MNEKKVVQAAPAARGSAIIATMLAVPTLAITVALAQHRLEAFITSVLIAAFWSAGMIVMQRKLQTTFPPTVLGEQDKLPPIAATWKVTTSFTAVLAVLDAAAVIFSLSMHPQTYLVVGIVLGAPAVIWSSFVRIERLQHQYKGTLWSKTGFALRAKGRAPYVVKS